MALIDRYLWARLRSLWLLSLILFTLIVFFSDAFLDLLKELQRYGLPLSTIGGLVLLQLPAAFALALPPSTFIAVLMGLNTLNHQFELIAARANGVSLKRIAMPIVTFGLLVSLVDAVLVNAVVPACNQLADQLKIETLEKGIIPTGKSQFTLMDFDKEQRLEKMLYVGQVNKAGLSELTLVDVSKPKVMKLIQAAEGKAEPNPEGAGTARWIFNNANVYLVGKRNTVLVHNHVGTLTRQTLLGQSDELDKLKQHVNLYGLSFNQLKRFIKEKQTRQEAIPPKYWIRLWDKVTLPASALALVLVAIPLALTPPRQGGERGFVFAIAALFGFYVVRAIGLALAQASWMPLPPMVAIGLGSAIPVLILALLGLSLLQRKERVL